jgi:hypothetical protein
VAPNHQRSIGGERLAGRNARAANLCPKPRWEMARFDHQIRTDGLKSELGCGEWLRYDRDDPTRRSAGPIFEHRTDHPRDGQSLYGQLRLFAPILGVAAASRQFWINYLELLHAHR